MTFSDDKDFMKHANFETFKMLDKNMEEKIEFGDGHILMSSSTSIIHNILIKRISREIDKSLAAKGCESFTEAIELIMDCCDKIYRFKPDLFVLCKDNINLVGQSIKSVPPLIFEVVSNSNANHDTVYKRKYYADCGVIEYCLVYQDGTIEQLKLMDNMYRTVAVLSDGIYKSISFPDVTFDVSNIFFDLDIYR